MRLLFKAILFLLCRMKQQQRLRYTGGLMILSMLLLSGFLYSWLKSQYQEEKVLLRKELITLYSRSQQKIIDSLLDAELAKVMSKDFTKHLKGTTFKSTVRIDISDSSEDNFSFSRQDQQLTINTSDSDSTILTSGLNLGLRTLLLKASRTMQDSSFMKLDSLEIKKDFEQALQESNLPLGVSWGPGAKSTMALSVPGLSATGDINISNYRSVLWRRILPQASFSLVLLVLCGGASLLAYQTIRQQVRLSRQKDDLISNISHELKTPVATAKVALEALNNFNALDDPKKTRDYLQIAGREIDRLEQLTGSILNQMQLEQGRIDFRKEPLDVGAILQELATELQPALQETGTSFSLDTSGLSGKVSGDRIHIRGALYNVLDNALKYGGNTIGIKAYREGQTIHVRIADKGPGIPPEYRNRIFERFFRIPSGNRHDVKGYGLGLHYTRYVIQNHGGQIQVCNENTNGGAVFELTLPVA